jgi:hypothetical protein
MAMEHLWMTGLDMTPLDTPPDGFLQLKEDTSVQKSRLNSTFYLLLCLQ